MKLYKQIGIASALASLVGFLAYEAVTRYVIHKAEENLQSIILSHQSFHHYIQRVMHPVYYRAIDQGNIRQDFYAPEILSSSYIVRVVHQYFNEERAHAKLSPVYYKLASNNPRNALNRADEKEASLIKLFNERRDIKDRIQVITIDGKKYLAYARPFLETNQACQRCHGKRSDAPPGLQKIYTGQGGFNESVGIIRAIESIRIPLNNEYLVASIVTSTALSGALILSTLFLFNLQMRNRVRQSTAALESEIEERKTIQAALKTSEESYRQLASLTSDFVHRCVRLGRSPYRIEWVGGALAAISGYSPEEIFELGCWMPMLHPDDRERTTAALETLKPGETSELYFRIIRKDGEERWIGQKCRCEKGEKEDSLVLYGAATDVTERREAEEMLKYTRISVDAASDAIFWIRPDASFQDVNEAACRRLGYTREELLNMRVAEIAPGFTEERWQQYRQTICKGGTVCFESMHRSKDGRVFPVEVVANYVRQEDREYFCSFVRDISDRKRMEEALRTSDRFNRQIINSAHEGIVVYGLDLRYQVWNPFMERLNGLKNTEVLGKHPLELFPFLEDIKIVERLEKALAGEIPEDIEVRFEINGHQGWAIDSSSPLRNEDGEIIGVIATIQDITERKLAEQSLRQSEERFRSVVESSPSAMYFYRLETDDSLILTGANPSADRIVGIAHGDLIGKRIEHAFPHIKNTAVPDIYRKVAKGLLGQQTFELTYDHEQFQGSYDVQVYRTAPETIAVHFVDITDRKRAEEERISLEKQLLHAQKLESLGVLAGGIAHDFNNILTSIVGNTDLALIRLNPESPARDNLHRIEKAATRASDLAKQMLAYSGKGKFVIEAVDLNRLVEEMTHMLQVSISKKAVLRFNHSQPLPSVDGDATQLRQIIMNLVINASEAIGDKSGVIAINTGCTYCDQRYLGSASLNENIPEGLYVWVEVADTGCGMEKETMSRIFDPFFSTKFTGRGLGMAAVQGIVRGHKGAIKIYSEPGKGTTFKVLLPAGDRPKELFDDQTDRNPQWKGKGTVLLVDDEETVIGIGTEMLQELGFTVLTATNGREALEVFRQYGSQISLVILDLTMPHMDGEQTFRELRQIMPEVKVIISSGYNEQEVTQRFVGKGLGGFIQKPYKLSVLKEMVMDMEKKTQKETLEKRDQVR